MEYAHFSFMYPRLQSFIHYQANMAWVKVGTQIARYKESFVSWQSRLWMDLLDPMCPNIPWDADEILLEVGVEDLTDRDLLQMILIHHHYTFLNV